MSEKNVNEAQFKKVATDLELLDGVRVSLVMALHEGGGLAIAMNGSSLEGLLVLERMLEEARDRVRQQVIEAHALKSMKDSGLDKVVKKITDVIRIAAKIAIKKEANEDKTNGNA